MMIPSQLRTLQVNVLGQAEDTQTMQCGPAIRLDIELCLAIEAQNWNVSNISNTTYRQRRRGQQNLIRKRRRGFAAGIVTTMSFFGHCNLITM